MIISASTRTDIPAFYSDWLFNRIKEGYVYVRNPYNAHQVSNYSLSPEVVDAIVLWTKNPIPMMDRVEELIPYHPYFFVTVTPYGRDLEPFVPEAESVLEAVKQLSYLVGKDSVCLRYDPILIDETYTVAYHKMAFHKMLKSLSGHISDCVISFLDIYEKTKRNYKGAMTMTTEQMEEVAASFAEIGRQYNVRIKTCAEAIDLTRFGVFNSGCISKEMIERHLKTTIKHIPKQSNRSNCTCIESKDIGAYNTCLHGCKYCYANYDAETVRRNVKGHNKNSPFLIGGSKADDVITNAKQESILDGQLRFDFLL